MSERATVVQSSTAVYSVASMQTILALTLLFLNKGLITENEFIEAMDRASEDAGETEPPIGIAAAQLIESLRDQILASASEPGPL